MNSGPSDRPLSSSTGSAVNPDDAVVRASPVVRRLAAGNDISLSGVAGSGPGGRIVLRDLDAFDLVDAAGVKATRRRAPARRPRAWPTRPSLAQANLSVDIELDALLEVRQSVRQSVRHRGGPSELLLSALFIKALGLALRAVPAANVSLQGDRLERRRHCDIAFAETLDNGTVVFPTLIDADRRSVWDLSRSLQGMRQARQKQQPAPSVSEKNVEPDSGTAGDRQARVSLVNMGRGSIRRYETPLPPGHAMVLAIGGARPCLLPPAVGEHGGGTPVVATSGGLAGWRSGVCVAATLGCDIRMMSGVIAAEVIEVFKRQIEAPEDLFDRAPGAEHSPI